MATHAALALAGALGLFLVVVADAAVQAAGLPALLGDVARMAALFGASVMAAAGLMMRDMPLGEQRGPADDTVRARRSAGARPRSRG
ncbi:MAG: hypothetical protein AAF677_13800 [Pseudomonadota bacterium]